MRFVFWIVFTPVKQLKYYWHVISHIPGEIPGHFLWSTLTLNYVLSRIPYRFLFLNTSQKRTRKNVWSGGKMITVKIKTFTASPPDVPKRIESGKKYHHCPYNNILLYLHIFFFFLSFPLGSFLVMKFLKL